MLAVACRDKVPGLKDIIAKNEPVLARLKELLGHSSEWKKIIIEISNNLFPLYKDYTTLLPPLFSPPISTVRNPVIGLTDAQGLQVKTEMLSRSSEIRVAAERVLRALSERGWW